MMTTANQYPGNDQGYQEPYGGQFAPAQQQMMQPQMTQPPMNSPTQGAYYQQQPNQPIAPQTVNYQNFQNYGVQQQQQQPNQTISPPPPVHEPPKPKAPLPEEFIYMQTVLDELKVQCISAAGNPVS